MAPALDEQRVEEEEACARTSQTRHGHVYVRASVVAPRVPRARTFESESVVTHAFTQILPHHVFHIFQRARLQRRVEARPLTTIGQNSAAVTETKEASCAPLTFPSMTDVSLPGKS